MPRIYDFNIRLAQEKRMWPIAEKFFKQVYPNMKITRFYWDIPENQPIQRQDIDVQVGDMLISEKFRRSDCQKFNDLMVEIYSNTDLKLPGDVIKSKAEYLHYWKGNDVYIFKEKHVKERCNIIFDVFSKYIEMMLERNVPGGEYHAVSKIHSTTIQTFRQRKNKFEWNNMTVTIPLKEIHYDLWKYNGSGWTLTNNGLQPNLFDF